jgi:hypothetical protein
MVGTATVGFHTTTLRDSLRNSLAGSRRRQGFSILVVLIDRFFYDLAKLGEHLLFVVAMAAAVE